MRWEAGTSDCTARVSMLAAPMTGRHPKRKTRAVLKGSPPHNLMVRGLFKLSALILYARTWFAAIIVTSVLDMKRVQDKLLHDIGDYCMICFEMLVAKAFDLQVSSFQGVSISQRNSYQQLW